MLYFFNWDSVHGDVFQKLITQQQTEIIGDWKNDERNIVNITTKKLQPV